MSSGEYLWYAVANRLSVGTAEHNKTSFNYFVRHQLAHVLRESAEIVATNSEGRTHVVQLFNVHVQPPSILEASGSTSYVTPNDCRRRSLTYASDVCGDVVHDVVDEEGVVNRRVYRSAGQRVVAVAAGATHSLATTADGALWSWGDGSYGKLGHGRFYEFPKGTYEVCVLGHSAHMDQLLPKKIEALAGQRVVAVSASPIHNLAITADGAFWSWGLGGCDELGYHSICGWLPKKIKTHPRLCSSLCFEKSAATLGPSAF